MRRVAGGATFAMTRPRVALVTFGCRVNQYETDAMRAALAATCDVVEGEADLYILNACSVTGLAEKKARQAVHRLREESPGALVIVIGCLADAASRGLSTFAQADVIAESGWKPRIGDAVDAALAGQRGLLAAPGAASPDDEVSLGPVGRVRAALKVQDGCSGACAYCHAVHLRGPSRSKSVLAASAECLKLVARGYPEVVLTGVNLAEYGAPDGDLPRLIGRLLEVPGLKRLRLASLNVSGLSDDLLRLFAADPRLCQHFHVPLQSGDDRILRAMRRAYTADGYRRALARVRMQLPGATFGSDVIVGFPGEDETAFEATCRVVSEIGFSNLHVFRFSRRRGTEAADLPGAVADVVKRDRATRLTDAWRAQRARFLDGRVGSVEDVLIETRRGREYQGRSAGYLEVAFTSERELSEGSVCSVRVIRASRDGLEGVDDDRHRAD